jgi:hypothetical protein
MDPITATLLEHGYAVLFAFVLLDQIGLPMPALPVLIAAGGLAGAGRLDPALTVGVVALAAILGDWVWYELGRRYGLAGCGKTQLGGEDLGFRGGFSLEVLWNCDPARAPLLLRSVADPASVAQRHVGHSSGLILTRL